MDGNIGDEFDSPQDETIEEDDTNIPETISLGDKLDECLHKTLRDFIENKPLDIFQPINKNKTSTDKTRVTVILASNASGNHKLKPLVIGKSLRPRAFHGIQVSRLSITYKANKKAWMRNDIFNGWVSELDQIQDAVRGLGVLVNEIPNIIPTIFIDNYNRVQYDLMDYINDEISPHTEEILNDTQIINLVQNKEVPAAEDNTDNEEELTPKVLSKEAFDAIKKVILFYEQQPIDNSCKMEDLKLFRYYTSDLKFRYSSSLQQKSIETYFSYS
ncbi:unnamed protein product [Rhizophagus irregularis]|nr:unnamed protein product [Rhizophagus irregularis]